MSTPVDPTVDELTAAKLEAALLRVEVLQLHLQQRTADMHALAKSVEPPGYVVRRSPDGTWAYHRTSTE